MTLFHSVRVAISRSWSDPTPAHTLPALTPPALPGGNIKLPEAALPPVPATSLRDALAAITPPTIEAAPRLTPTYSPPPSSLLLSTFAGDDNGWRATGLSLEASGMSYLPLTAQRDPGNAAGALFLQFEDLNLAPASSRSAPPVSPSYAGMIGLVALAADIYRRRRQ